MFDHIRGAWTPTGKSGNFGNVLLFIFLRQYAHQTTSDEMITTSSFLIGHFTNCILHMVSQPDTESMAHHIWEYELDGT